MPENEPHPPAAGETNGPKYLYRGDDRHPDTIFEEGFKPRGDSDDLELHAYNNTEPPSNFISTSILESVATGFATKHGEQSGWLYIIRYQKNGRDVNKELGSNSAFKEEKEIAVPGGVDRSEILGVTHIQKDGTPSDKTKLNPNRDKK